MTTKTELQQEIAKAIQELSANWGVDRKGKSAEIGSKLYKIRDCEAVMVEVEGKVYYGLQIGPNHKTVWYRKEPPHLILADPSLQHLLGLLYSARD
jgi:hypothetical protein